KNATKKQIAFIENWINNYPKKILSYKSPNDVLLNG
ncbi:IS30 family transposase, partial [Streptococcus loxodontisalivarius]